MKCGQGLACAVGGGREGSRECLVDDVGKVWKGPINLIQLGCCLEQNGSSAKGRALSYRVIGFQAGELPNIQNNSFTGYEPRKRMAAASWADASWRSSDDFRKFGS